MGNRGQHLGVHAPVLKYSATFYASPTNAQAVTVLAQLPKTTVTPTEIAGLVESDLNKSRWQPKNLGAFSRGCPCVL